MHHENTTEPNTDVFALH